MNIKINTHSSIQIDDMAFDPYDADKIKFKAKYIFITHTHYDHLDIPSIKSFSNKKTIFIAPYDAKETLELHFDNKIIYVKPYDEINLETCQVEVLPSYNINKDFHKKESNWVGYKVIKDGVVYAVLGDTDATPELENLKAIDVLFVPIGGTYTMNAKEAAALSNKIKPKLVVPVHYGTVVGTKADEKEFLKNLDKKIKSKILL
jgi:L-ascorbate metabolism protein UlaG (beta-lactamase superfamily)